MNIIMITAMCIIATIICKFFDKDYKEYSYIIYLVVVCAVLFIAVSYISPLAKTIEDIFNETGVSKEYLEIIFKAIGICYVTQLGCDYCKDANENALCSELELAGKISLLIISLPLFEKVLEIIKKII